MRHPRILYSYRSFAPVNNWFPGPRVAALIKQHFSTCPSLHRPLLSNPSSARHQMLCYIALFPLVLTWRVIAGDARCGFRYGRPSASDCIFLVNHLIPQSNDPEGWVLYTPPRENIRLPLVYYVRELQIARRRDPSSLPRQAHAWFT